MDERTSRYISETAHSIAERLQCHADVGTADVGQLADDVAWLARQVARLAEAHTPRKSATVELWEAVERLLYEIQTCDHLATKNGDHPNGEEFVGSYTISSGLWHGVLREYQNVQAAGVELVKPILAAGAPSEDT
jgi:hypothetical protein